MALIQFLLPPAPLLASLLLFPFFSSALSLCGELWDADLGLYFLRARYLDVQSGRFWTQDSFGGDNLEPLSLHKYLYGHSSPVNNWDPSGHWSVGVIFTTLIVVAAISLIGAYVLYQRLEPRIGSERERLGLFVVIPDTVVPNGPNGVRFYAGGLTGKRYNSNGLPPHYTWVQCFKTDVFPEDPTLQNQWIEDPPKSSPYWDNFPYYYNVVDIRHSVVESANNSNFSELGHRKFDTVFGDTPGRSNPPDFETWRAELYLVKTTNLQSENYEPILKLTWGFNIKGKKFEPVQASPPQKATTKPNCKRMK